MQFDDFLSILDLLQNPDKYKAQIAELTERNAQIQESINQLNLSVSVVKAQKQADEALVLANKTLEDAKAQAADMLAKQQAAFDTRLANLADREVAADQAMTTFRNAKLGWANRAQEHAMKEEVLANKQKQVDAAQEALITKQQEVDARLAKLRDVMG